MKMVMKCDCSHKLQDELHGKGKRVFNPTTRKQGDRKVYRCTVCGKERAS